MNRSPEVLLIGALGYIGSRLLIHLRAAGHPQSHRWTAPRRRAPTILPADCRHLSASDSAALWHRDLAGRPLQRQDGHRSAGRCL
jgi:nucleoside-diphosphate-sugar epimerase